MGRYLGISGNALLFDSRKKTQPTTLWFLKSFFRRTAFSGRFVLLKHGKQLTAKIELRPEKPRKMTRHNAGKTSPQNASQFGLWIDSAILDAFGMWCTDVWEKSRKVALQLRLYATGRCNIRRRRYLPMSGKLFPFGYFQTNIFNTVDLTSTVWQLPSKKEHRSSTDEICIQSRTARHGSKSHE